jgi:L-rhamnose isomerase/sugar isomerase
MIDQSHNVTDPIESLMTSAAEIAGAYARALLVDADALASAQARNDALAAHGALKAAFQTDVRPLLAESRARAGGALDPVAVYRASGWREGCALRRPAVGPGAAGIV